MYSLNKNNIANIYTNIQCDNKGVIITNLN